MAHGIVPMINVGVPDAVPVFEAAKATGAQIDMELEKTAWGGLEFTVVDPDGYVIAIADKFPGA